MVTIECVCPPRADGGVRHPDGDTVTLRERLDFRAALTARNTITWLKNEDPDAGVAEILAALTETYLLVGIESWTLVDDKGKPVEVSRTTIRELLRANPAAAMQIGDAADELYSAAVLLPLLAQAARSSPPMPTDGSTSAATASSAKSPRPSRQSSTTTIQTGVTGPTSPSPDGASS